MSCWTAAAEKSWSAGATRSWCGRTPRPSGESDRKNRGWRTANARYSRSSTGGGHWDKNKLPESWLIAYKNLRFQVKPMNFKHTGLFPEQAANWDFAMDQIRRAAAPSGC